MNATPTIRIDGPHTVIDYRGHTATIRMRRSWGYECSIYDGQSQAFSVIPLHTEGAAIKAAVASIDRDIEVNRRIMNDYRRKLRAYGERV